MAVKLAWGDAIAMQCRAAGLPEPVPEHRFHPTRRWKFDLAWPDLKVAFEREGMARPGGKSRHTTFTGYSNDCEKYNEAAIMGWVVIRATVKQLNSGAAWEWVREALELKGAE